MWTDANDSYDYKIRVHDEASDRFVEFYAPEEGVIITEVDIFKDYIVLYLRKNSKAVLRVINIASKDTHDLDIGQEICTIIPGLNEGFNTSKFNFFVSTPFVYNEAYQYDIGKRQLTPFAKFEPTGPKFDTNKFKSHVVFAPSETGDLIPISIIEKVNRKGPSKLLLKVYGYYGLDNTVSY